MSLAARLGLALVVALGTAAASYAVAPPPPQPVALGPGEITVVMDVEHSLFAPAQLHVVEGTEVRFVVRNGDPINHELIIGPDEVHEAHRLGDHPEHDPVPGEVSVPALERAVTTYRFAEPGTVAFACHLPGHREHGMHGEVEVVPSRAQQARSHPRLAGGIRLPR